MESSWKMAVSATLHCLTGCAIGEVAGTVIGTALNLSNIATVLIAILLAFFFGYAFTMFPLVRNGINFKIALGLALAADTVSIAIMEIADNGFIVLIPGAMDATLRDLLFWVSLTASLMVAFAVALPVNRYLISRGKGHAAVHSHHH